MNSLTTVGQKIPKRDAPPKAIGAAVYIQDMKVPGMLHGKILYSKHPHARILKLDTSRAEKLAGVRAVITAADMPSTFRIGVMKDNPPLKTGKVLSIRDEIAAVAATSPEIAEEALSLIEVEYEVLPGIFDPIEAMKEGAMLLHEETKSNVLKLPWKLVCGDVEAAKKEAVFIVEDTFSTPWVTHCCLGTSGCIAQFDTNNNLTMYSNTQIPSLAQNDYIEALNAFGLKNKRVRIVQCVIGGGFGSKLDTYSYEYIAIRLSLKTRKPVKIIFSREEEFFATSPRQCTITKISHGCDREGRLMFREIEMVLDNGAYTSWGATTPSVMMLPISSLYKVPNVKYTAKCVYTNNTYSQAMRGYGNPQATFAIESSLDQLAEIAGIDPYELRLKNANEPGEVTPQRFKITSCGMKECIEEVVKRLNWKGKHGRGAGRGVGMASLIHVGGGARVYKSDGCGTIIKMDDFGKVDVFTGASDIGQGSETIIAQIVAEVLGIPIDDVNVINNDTDICPWDVGVHASRTTFVAGNAALGAALKIKSQVLEAAAKLLEEDPAYLDIKNGIVFSTRNKEKSTSLGKALRKAHYTLGGKMLMAEYFYDPKNENFDKEFKGNLSVSYAYGTHGVEVEVDKETGQVKILDYVAAHDVGKAINPLLLEGQIYGGGLQGVGYALGEKMVYVNGELKNGNFLDYKIPTAKDVPPMQAVIVETDEKDGPFGAKGIGEPGLVPTAPAIANAIYDAVGVRIKDLPITPEKVLKALKGKEKIG
ncbi:MAG TPA: xanthine dehydrogenase family protein molybdopterin-binding subunit [Syntrophorhabdus sp.]|jgi:xanthine dehydrogenase molybdenum-binding subunit|nr:xanthine dehydrogenase family protein molybdopterin-binding subunit [Syntrophorhabdus sp.]OQB78100.1 MAG: 4-hydroxybenzoyl-CoA reductase subunit alpha [Deltaproteobacteria bacterium ADurb.Bin135]HOD77978.1 xanthine dehydrogenase family protein molybdopterin-binding subunit [Syntrophorhabdus sp.]HQH83252.1 xanthine dehydrogenase family protein molybdopterin-binding subunit [Syntrophorhabdus sp.]HQM26596.1 xanthine dehydrogenase family protein molybdopterin-binding subunit [Syntrophorhabdus sp